MTPDPGFAADVRRAASMWRGSRLVPAVYLLMGLAYASLALFTPQPPETCAQPVNGRCPLEPGDLQTTTGLFLLVLPAALFHIGLSGTCRVWYLRRFAGNDLTPGEVWSFSWRFLGRFFLLGLLLVAVVLPITVPFLVLSLQRDSGALALVGSAVATVVADVLFTFATPGLALYTTSPWRAFTGGLAILRSAWPQCALYALVPPMALMLLAQGSSDQLGRPLSAAMALASPLLTLLFAGASAAFVLRRWPAVGPDGAQSAPRYESYADRF